MNPFLMTPDERMHDWKAFRKSLAERCEEDQLKAVALYWSQASMLRIAYDPDNAASWPSTWQMVHDGDWCRDSVAIGMEATLRLSGWDATRLLLRHVIDQPESKMVLVLQVDHSCLLNFEWGRVVSLPRPGMRAIRTWRFDGRKYVEA